MDNKHHIAITGIIIREGKYLITKRSLNKRLFPGMWTVPDGNLETIDYINDKKDTSSHWYNLEKIKSLSLDNRYCFLAISFFLTPKNKACIKLHILVWSGHCFFDVVEKVLRRKVMEEVGLEIKNIKYLTNMTMMNGNNPLMIFSLYCDHYNGDVILNDESVDHKWVTLKEAKDHDLIEGIYEELEMLDKIPKGGVLKNG